MIKKITNAIAIVGAVIGLVAGLSSYPAHAVTVPTMSVNGRYILKNGAGFVPRGITLDTLQESTPYLASGTSYTTPLSEIEAQMDSAENYWHANTVRIQFEQDTLVNPSTYAVNTTYLATISSALDYAENLGLVPVLSDQTEPSFDSSTTTPNEPLPTEATLHAWKALKPVVNQGAMLDIFNEPRGSGSTALYKNQMQVTINNLRSYGYTNPLWVQSQMWTQVGEFTSIGGFTDPLNKSNPQLVYAYHHLPNNEADWQSEVWNWAAAGHAVVDGEWTNRTMGTATANQCWPNAPTSVPDYLNYLRDHQIGITVWTMGQDASGNTFLNARNGGFNSADGYDAKYSCSQPEGTEGAGESILSNFTNYTSNVWAPYVIGQRVSVAEATLRNAGFNTWNYSTSVPKGHTGIVTGESNRYVQPGAWISLTYKVN